MAEIPIRNPTIYTENPDGTLHHIGELSHPININLHDADADNDANDHIHPNLLSDLKSLSFSCKFHHDPNSDDFYEELRRKLEHDLYYTHAKFKFPVRLWRRVILWLLGVRYKRGLPPPTHTIEGRMTEMETQPTEGDDDGSDNS